MATGFQASPPRQKPFGSNCFVTSPAPRRLFGVRTTGASCAPRGRVAPRKSEYRRGSSCDQVVDLCARQSSNAVYTSKWYTSLCSSKRRQLLRYTITGFSYLLGATSMPVGANGGPCSSIPRPRVTSWFRCCETSSYKCPHLNNTVSLRVPPSKGRKHCPLGLPSWTGMETREVGSY